MIIISEFDFTSYIHLVNFLGGCMDSNTEIVLFSLDNINRSIVAIHGGHISGRKVGDPLTNFAISKLKDKGKDGPPYYLNYVGVSKDGTPLRSSSFFILDKSGNPRGVLTISSDVTRYQKAAELLAQLAFLPNMETVSSESVDIERFQATPKDLILDIIFDVTKSRDIDTRRLTPDEKIEVVRRLNVENFFLMKGAVSQIASVLDSSDATIYRYLSKINKQNGSVRAW
ncbi:MAG TPA: PAS domain-containing protein [Fusibacter sp.]|nr:PAS domain-containing protein [Fusibacter sp.]